MSPRSGLISSASAPVAGRVFEVWADSTEDAAEDDRTQESSPVPDVARETPAIELTAVECRVLGAMIEKSYLTPDIYPMTTNAMVTACNQKTNRDPVVDYSAVLIDTTLMEMRERNLVRRVHSPGSRSMKHRQTLDEVTRSERTTIGADVGAAASRTTNDRGAPPSYRTPRCGV